MPVGRTAGKRSGAHSGMTRKGKRGFEGWQRNVKEDDEKGNGGRDGSVWKPPLGMPCGRS